MGIPFIGGFFNWLFNQIVLFALFSLGFIGLKYLLSSILKATVDNIDNFILKIIARFTLPSILGIGLAFLAFYLKCKALAEFLIVMAIAIGGPVTWGIMMIIQPMLNFSVLNSLYALLIILMVFSIVELVIPILLPGLGILISLLISIVELIIIYIYIGNDIRGMINCFMALVGHKVIPGTGGVSIGA